MRARFRECDVYFTDALGDNVTAYLPENVLGVSTERERSVLKQNLPVYRSLLTRNDNVYATVHNNLGVDQTLTS